MSNSSVIVAVRGRAASARMTNLPREINTFDFVVYFYAKGNLQKEETNYHRRDMAISSFARCEVVATK
jgi:hypothetical protein